MRTIVQSSTFKKYYKRALKRGRSKEKIANILTLLATDGVLPASFRPHKLLGNYSGYMECHIEPDWLLIYECNDTELRLRRTGTHADLFE